MVTEHCNLQGQMMIIIKLHLCINRINMVLEFEKHELPGNKGMDILWLSRLQKQGQIPMNNISNLDKIGRLNKSG